MVNRGNFRKVKEENNSQCWYCQGPTNSTLTFKNGDEIWCCKKDALIHGKVKRLKNISASHKTQENSENLHIKNQENGISNHSQTAERPQVEQDAGVRSPAEPIFKTALELEQEVRDANH